MILTELEAKQRWCPFSRAQGQGQELSHNRPDSSYNCIASDCMAWAWLEPPGPRHPDMPERDDRGHCGLAGQHQ